jgi:hypothetical protein
MDAWVERPELLKHFSPKIPSRFRGGYTILEAGENAVQRRLRALKEAANNGNAAADLLLKHADETACGNIAAALDDFIRTGRTRPVQFRLNTPAISTLEEMATSRGGEATRLLSGKTRAQQEILEIMMERGPGSSAVIMFQRGRDVPGHFVNAVNIDGQIWLIDAHAGFAVNARRPGVFLQAWDGLGNMAIPEGMGIHIILPKP